MFYSIRAAQSCLSKKVWLLYQPGWARLCCSNKQSDNIYGFHQQGFFLSVSVFSFGISWKLCLVSLHSGTQPKTGNGKSLPKTCVTIARGTRDCHHTCQLLTFLPRNNTMADASHVAALRSYRSIPSCAQGGRMRSPWWTTLVKSTHMHIYPTAHHAHHTPGDSGFSKGVNVE